MSSNMAVNPDPRKLLLPDPDAIPSFLSDKFSSMLGGTLAGATVFLHKYLARRPVLSGLHVYALGIAGGVIGAKYLEDRHNRYNMDRDATLRHYIELHPEDFPVPERKKVGDVFQTWTPVR